MQVKNGNEMISAENKTKYQQEDKDIPNRGHKTKLSSDSLKEKLHSNMNNSDSFQIFNSFQEDDLNNDNINIYVEEQIKNKIFKTIDVNQNKDISITNTIEEEDDLEKFYEQQQIEMEKALKKNSNQGKSKSKEKFKSDQNKISKNSFSNIDNNNNLNKNSVISSNYNNNFNTTISYKTQKNNYNNNFKNSKNINTNSSINLKDLNTIDVKSNKNEKLNLINNKHIRNNSAVNKRNVSANNISNIKTSFEKASPPKKLENNKSNMKNINNRPPSKNAGERNNSNIKPNKTLSKIKNVGESNIIDNSKVKVKISSSKVNNSMIINNNKITYEDYKSSISGKIEPQNTGQNKGLNKSESTNNMRTARKLSLDKNRLDSASKQNALKISGFKDYTNNKNNIHNIIKLKISHSKVEELITSKDYSNSREKKSNSNYASIFDKKKNLEKNNLSNANITANNNNISDLNSKPANFLTIQEPENYVNKIQVGNTFRKNTANLKINTNNNANLSANLSENLNTNKIIGNLKTPITPGIHSFKSEKAPIKISAVEKSNSYLNDKSKVSHNEKNHNPYPKSDLNTDLANYLKQEKEKNSYTYLLNKSKNSERESKAVNKKINSHHEIPSAENLKKLNDTIDAVVSSDKNGKINASSKRPSDRNKGQNKDQILIEKILKENNISFAKGMESDEKRCLTSNEKLNEFFSMNLNFDAIVNNEKDDNNLLLNDKNEFSEIGLSELKSDEHFLFDYNNNKNNKDLKNNIDNSNYLINSNISNNLKISHNSYLRNFNNNKANDNKDFLKDNSLANLLFNNEKNNLKEPEKTENKNNQNSRNNSLVKVKLENLTNMTRSNQYVSNIIRNTNSNLNNNNNNNNNYTNNIEDTKQSNSDKMSQYTELYNKRRETLEKLNKSNMDKDKDFYEKNIEWKKKLNERASIIKEQVDKERFKECYFTPKGVKKPVSKEAIENFYEKNMIWKQNVEKYKQTQNLIKERKEYEECFFQPTTNKKVYESNICSYRENKKPDEFYKKNIEWLERTRENKKNAELQYQEEIRAVNKDKRNLNYEDFDENISNNYSAYDNTPKSLNKTSQKIKTSNKSLSPRENNNINRSFCSVPHLRTKKHNKNKNQIQEETPEIQEDPDIKLEKDLREMEILMQSLQKIINENDQIMSIPENQDEFLLYNNMNNQSFANNDPNNIILNYKINYNNIYVTNKSDEQEREKNYKADVDPYRNYAEMYDEKYNILKDKIKREKFIKIEDKYN